MSIFDWKRCAAVCLALTLLATACARRTEAFSELPDPSEAETVSKMTEEPFASEEPPSEEKSETEPSSEEEEEPSAEPAPTEEPSEEPVTQESEPESSAAPASELPVSEPSSEEPVPASSVEELTPEPVSEAPSEEPSSEPSSEPIPEAPSEEPPTEKPAPLQPITIVVEEEEEPETPDEPMQPAAPAPQTYTSVIIDGLTYINGIPIVNKTYSVPREYAPGVNPTAYAAFETMRDAAAQEGINLFIISGYRSYDHQANTYQRYVNRDGQAAADRYSARPGHSEHQTGLCFDLNSLLFSFGDTAEGKWLAAHCDEYGFIIRYPIDGESSTGYRYEPWHIRYLGTELAQSVTASGLTLEDYLGITSVYAE